nr:immunoglobulin heavy chain junction region [Macaca mulatta]
CARNVFGSGLDYW